MIQYTKIQLERLDEKRFSFSFIVNRYSSAGDPVYVLRVSDARVDRSDLEASLEFYRKSVDEVIDTIWDMALEYKIPLRDFNEPSSNSKTTSN